MAALDRKLATIEGNMNAAMDAAKANAQRDSAPQLAQLPRITQAMTLEKLHEYGFSDAVRLKEEINKDAMAAWPDERLEMVGMKRRQLDTFYIEIKAEEIHNAA